MSRASFVPGYYWQIAIRVLLITLNSLALAYFILRNQGWFTLINLSILLVLQIFLMIYYLNRVNRMLFNFFSSIRDEGTSLSFSRKGKSLSLLYKSLEDINQQMQRLREQKLSHSQYFHTLFEHVGVALLSFFEDGRIENINRAGRQLFSVQELTNIRKLQSIDPELPLLLTNLKPGKQRLVRFRKDHEQVQVSVSATELKLGDKKLKIVSLQNIGTELDEKEFESWQKLIRVLTHEIMNSVAPISSSIDTISGFYLDLKTGQPMDVSQINQSIVNHTLHGLEIIRDRSKGLLEFVKNYRRLTLLPQPSFSTIRVAEMIDQLHVLMKEKMESHQIHFEQSVESVDLTIRADKKLIEQVMINLLNNAVDAICEVTRKDGLIRVDAFRNAEEKVVIRIRDNGQGIPADIMDQVFIPFFTTKEEGTGIGLSLSRQIMRLHQGNILIESTEGKGARVSLVF